MSRRRRSLTDAMPLSHHAPIVATLWLGAGGCIGPLDAPTRYDAVEVLCGDDEAWARAVETCRARWEDDGTCGGVIHFAGQIDGIEVRVASELIDTEFENLRYSGGEQVRTGVSIIGRTEYNEFSLSFNGMGGEIGPDVDLPPLLLAPVVHELGDHVADSNFRMSNGFQSQDLRVVEGSFTRDLQDDLEQVGGFSAAYAAAEDRIDACFHLFATRLTTETIDEPMPREPTRARPEDPRGRD